MQAHRCSPFRVQRSCVKAPAKVEVAPRGISIGEEQCAKVAFDVHGVEPLGRADLGEMQGVPVPIASHPQRDGGEAEEEGEDCQGGEQSSAKDCQDPMSHEIQIVTEGVEQSRPLSSDVN